ncbi:hypothetical protein U9M48_031627 [Paspalum notatum var. saurae]|uniref:Uncharacterized protein n=1 Tax=Paspalum notatum var. saurae TaxID=547442 RepID=A0AAQ3U4B4_PASNO
MNLQEEEILKLVLLGKAEICRCEGQRLQFART